METKCQQNRNEPVQGVQMKFIPDNSGVKKSAEHEIQDPEREFPVYSGGYRNPELIGNILLRDFPEFCEDALQKLLKSTPKSLE